jgi:LysM repeat protein
MKPTTTYPTKHPHWIDEPEYLETITKKKRFGISFTTAFLLVLAIHIAGVGGIFAFSNQKPKAAAPAKPEPVAANPPAPKSDALARNEWPEPEAKPKVVATPPPVKKLVATAKVTPKSEPKPVAVVADKPKSPAPAISKPTPVVANTAPRQPQAADAARRKAFLATKTQSLPTVETREALPISRATVPLIATNPEVSAAPSIASAPTTPAPKPAAPAPRPSEYTLAAGDNLYMVSRKLQVSYNDLLQANGLSDPRQLRVGQKLKVPAEQIASL